MKLIANLNFRRSLRIVAESYAIKGLCLQKEGMASSKFKKAEREEELIKCFDLASDLSLLYMQKLEKELSSNTPNIGNTVRKTCSHITKLVKSIVVCFAIS